jgi:hypothetical protein
VVSDDGVIEGFEGGLEFKRDSYKSAIDMDQIQDLDSLGTVTAEFCFLDSDSIRDLVQAVLEILFMDRLLWTFIARMVGAIQNKGTLFQCDQEANQSLFFEDVFELLEVAFVLTQAVDMDWVTHVNLLSFEIGARMSQSISAPNLSVRQPLYGLPPKVRR